MLTTTKLVYRIMHAKRKRDCLTGALAPLLNQEKRTGPPPKTM